MHWVNLAGVVLLTLLVGWQWTTQRRLEQERDRLERTQREQAAQLATQARDLEFFRRQAGSNVWEVNLGR